MTYILEDQVFIIIMILYADDKSTVCCFGLVLDASFNFFFKKVLVGPLYYFNCCMEMSNSSNYSYDIILLFSLTAFVCLKKMLLHFIEQSNAEWTFIFRLQRYRTVTVYFNKCLGFFPLRRRDVTDRNITYTHWRPLPVVSGPAQPKYMYTPSTGHSMLSDVKV